MPTNPPVLLRATAATKSTIVVAWSPPETGTAPTHYEVRRQDNLFQSNVGTSTAFIFGGLLPDTEYTLGVRAVSGDGPSAWVDITAETLAFLREHFYRPVRDGSGALMVGSTVAVYKTGTTQSLDQTIFANPIGDEELGPGWLLDDGVIDFYLELPQIVDLHVMVPGRAEPTVFTHQWVGDFLDVDRVNDVVLATIADDPNSAFRDVEDTHNDTRYAPKSVLTLTNTGRLGTTQMGLDWEPRHRAANFSDFANAAASVNTSPKELGTPAWDSTNGRPLWAKFASPTAPWVDATGATVVTPA